MKYTWLTRSAFPRVPRLIHKVRILGCGDLKSIEGTIMELQVGDRGYWYNTLTCEDRPIEIVRVLKGRYVVKTDTGHCYSPPKSMVSHKRTDLRS